MSGEEKTAWLLKALHPDVMAKIMRHLGSERSERLRALMERLQPRPEVQPLLARLAQELDEALREPTPRTPVSMPATIRFPEPAPVEPRQPATTPEPGPQPVAASTPVPASSSTPLQADPLARLGKLPPERLAALLESENPRTIALILNYLSVEKAGAVFRQLPAGARNEASLQLAAQQTSNVEVLQRIAQALLLKHERLAEKPALVDGAARWQKMAEMLRLLEKPARLEVLSAIEAKDAAAASNLKELLYRFDDVLRLDNRSAQKILGELDTKTLASALKDADPAIRDKFFANLSKRAQDNLSEEMDLMQSVPKDQAEQAQKDIVAVLRRLDLAGELTMVD